MDEGVKSPLLYLCTGFDLAYGVEFNTADKLLSLVEYWHFSAEGKEWKDNSPISWMLWVMTDNMGMKESLRPVQVDWLYPFN